MDINDILARAKKNQKEAVTTSRYSTNVKPAKKLQRTVDPVAIKAFLERKKNEEIKNVKEAKKKKEELQKIRDVTKTTKKANSMAKRTKDNLKVYRGEDVLGLHTDPKKRRRGQPPSPPLSPEADRRHKAFMKNIVPKVKVPGVNDYDSDDSYSVPVLEEDERRIRKLEKKKAKARSASNLEFSELLQLAEKQKSKNDDNSSSSDENDDDDNDSGESDSDHDRHGRPLSAEEKYQRERRKRRELEERLKMASNHKPLPAASKTSHHHKSSSSNSLSNFKIGKLNSAMSEESKRLKVKELMEKLKKSSKDRSPQVEHRKEEKSNHNLSKSNMKKSRSSPALQSLSSKKHEDSIKSKHKPNGVRGESSKGNTNPLKPYHKSSTPDLKNGSRNQPSAISSQKRKLVKPSRPSSDSEMRQTKIDPHLRKKVPFSGEKSKPKPATEKHVSNPYKHTVVKQNMKRPAADTFVDPWAKPERGPSQNPGKKLKPTPAPGKCTLSVTSESVRTNYPGVAQEDPYISRYKKTGKVIPKLTPEMVARYKAAIMRKLQAEGRLPPGQHQKQRHGAFPNESEDEYDSELDDFIADDEVEEEVDDDVDVSSHIRQIFGYDKRKYGRESEWELSRMEASYKDIEKEEKKSLKIAREEDAREARLEEEKMKRKRR